MAPVVEFYLTPEETERLVAALPEFLPCTPRIIVTSWGVIEFWPHDGHGDDGTLLEGP